MNLTLKTIIARSLLILVLSSTLISATQVPSGTLPFPHFDKIAHAATFWMISYLLAHSMPAQAFGRFSWLCLLSYGFTMELIQWTLAYRSFSLGDLAADAVGIGLYHWFSQQQIMKPKALAMLKYKAPKTHQASAKMNTANIWQQLRNTAKTEAKKEPLLNDFLNTSILQHNSLIDALSHQLAIKLQSPTLSLNQLNSAISQSLSHSSIIEDAITKDLIAILERDSACRHIYEPFLYFKGFHALQAYRAAHQLWLQDRKDLALFLQNRISEVFGVDIHPAAHVGSGILLDHATGIVIGETAVVENNVSIMQSVTLGGTGKEEGDRHPKVRQGVLIGAGAKILGNIEIGEGAKIGAGSVVLNSVPAHTIAAGVPAEVIGNAKENNPALDMDHHLDCC